MVRSSMLFCCALLAACSGSVQEPSTSGEELTDTILFVHSDGRVEQATQVGRAATPTARALHRTWYVSRQSVH
jgi:hypothetical protein